MSEQRKGFVNLQRIRDLVGTGRDLKVYIDGSYSVSISYSANKVLELEPGTHHIFVKMDWCKSKPLKIEIRSGETLNLYCGSRFAHKSVLVNMFAAFLFPRNLFYVGTESILTVAQEVENKKRIAEILAYTFTLLLMLPVVWLSHGIALLISQYSDFANIAFIFISFIVIIFAAISIWKCLKKALEHSL